MVDYAVCEVVAVESVKTDPEALFAANEAWAAGLSKQFVRKRRIPIFLKPDLENAALVAMWQAAKRFSGDASDFRAFAYKAVNGALCDELSGATNDGEELANVELTGMAVIDRRAEHETPIDALDEVSRLLERTNGVERDVLEGVLKSESYSDIGKKIGMSGQRIGQIFAGIRQRARAMECAEFN